MINICMLTWRHDIQEALEEQSSNTAAHRGQEPSVTRQIEVEQCNVKQNRVARNKINLCNAMQNRAE